MLEPCDGMEFESHEDAYSFYKEYAKSLGFGTAKLSSRRSRASREFIDAKFSCIRYGNKQQSDEAVNPRPSPKIGCKASIHVKRRQNGKWFVYGFIKDHNHELLPDQAHFFRSHRGDIGVLKHDVRLRKRKILPSVSKQLTVYKNIDCFDGYSRSRNVKGRRLVLDSGDAEELLDFLTQMQEVYPKFFYSVDLNEELVLRNVFWVDSKGMDDFEFFSDVVCLDTSYFVNKYKVPLVLFVGVNNHIQPMLLGCALITDDAVCTFSWLMQTWRIAMGNRAPKVILTDQNGAIKATVSSIFPETRHYVPLWQVLEKLFRELDYLGLWNTEFVGKFNKCIYSSLSVEQFEKRWWKLIERFNLRENEWFESLYEDRSQWVPILIRDVSFSGMSTSTRAEGLNSFYDKYISSDTSLRQFISKYKTILEDWREEEAKANFDAWHETPELKSPSPFEKQVSLIYTHEIFKQFQNEVLGAAACHLNKEIDDQIVIVYAVTDLESSQNFTVEWNELEGSIFCSCRMFEYKGYICRHSIVVLQMSGVFRIPSKYILQRWTNSAASRYPIGAHMNDVPEKIRRFNDLCRRAIVLGEEGSISQKSYDIALCAIKDAFKQYDSFNSNSAPSIGTVNRRCDDQRVDESVHLLPAERTQECSMDSSNGNGRRLENWKGMSDIESYEKGKVILGSRVLGTHKFEGVHQMESSDPEGQPRLHNVVPTHSTLPQLHNMAPELFHNVPSTQFHSLLSAFFSDKRHPQ